MITAKFAGRLGNNMFQMAAAIGLAAHNDDVAVFHKDDVAKVKHAHYFSGIKTKCSCKKHEVSRVYKEPTFNHHEIRYIKNMELSGWFQSEKYFAHCRQQILDAFNFNAASIPYVGVHVRRGDYLALSDKFPFVGLDYLRRAIALFPSHQFLIFSDDIAWCTEQFVGPQFQFSTGTPVQDLELMSQCQHQVISNSTFSWWAAWLNRNPNKTVIAPSTWFGPGNGYCNNTQDIIPTAWTRI